MSAVSVTMVKAMKIAAKATKTIKKMPAAYSHVTPREEELIRQWEKEGVPKAEIMRRTGRSKDTVTMHLQRSSKPVGRKPVITPAICRSLQASMRKLQKQAKAKKEVTVAMIKADAGVDASDRTVLEAFHEKDIYFRTLRARPILKDSDIPQRKKFAEQYKGRSAEAWLDHPDAVIDNKHFPLARDCAARAEVARRQVRGGYRARAEQPRTYLVRQRATQKYPMKGVQVTAAIVAGKIRMWRYTKGSWCGKEADKMYHDLEKVLKKAKPDKEAKPCHRWSILEDNDPAGYKSSAGKRAKKDCKMVPFSLPPRSPDMNPLDFSIWHEVNVRMRRQEAKMGGRRRESEEAFKKRLRRVAMTLPTSVVSKAVKDMHRRTNELYAANGRLFTESK